MDLAVISPFVSAPSPGHCHFFPQELQCILTGFSSTPTLLLLQPILRAALPEPDPSGSVIPYSNPSGFLSHKNKTQRPSPSQTVHWSPALIPSLCLWEGLPCPHIREHMSPSPLIPLPCSIVLGTSHNLDSCTALLSVSCAWKLSEDRNVDRSSVCLLDAHDHLSSRKVHTQYLERSVWPLQGSLLPGCVEHGSLLLS